MKRTLIAATAFAALLCGGARADDAAQPSAKFQCLIDGKPADPELLAAASDLQTTNGSAARMDELIDAMIPAMIDLIRQGDATISKDVLDAFANEFRTEMKAAIPQVLDETACVMARHYALADMQQLKAFYASPLGQKLLKESTPVAKEMFAVGQAWGQATGAAAARHVIEKLRAKGMKI
jgi:hypothetical protein